MNSLRLEHIRKQAIAVARYFNSEMARIGFINNARREDPRLIRRSLELFDSLMPKSPKKTH